jgi:hypothetical protein
MVPILLRPGERRAERKNVAIPVVLVSIVGTRELLICFGYNRSLPIGGYFAAMAGLVGVDVLVERFRTVTQGTQLGQYLIERRLGGGGMADVWLARRKGAAGVEHVLKVALKRMRPELASDPSFVQMFLHEARIIARLSHPHIVALHDVGQAEGEIYLAMELVEGAPLSRIIRLCRVRRESMREAAVVEVAVQLADALAYAHALAGEDGRRDATAPGSGSRQIFSYSDPKIRKPKIPALGRPGVLAVNDGAARGPRAPRPREWLWRKRRGAGSGVRRGGRCRRRTRAAGRGAAGWRRGRRRGGGPPCTRRCRRRRR